MATKKKPEPKKKSMAKKIEQFFAPPIVMEAPPVRRFRLLPSGKMVEHPQGDYVKYEDVK